MIPHSPKTPKCTDHLLRFSLNLSKWHFCLKASLRNSRFKIRGIVSALDVSSDAVLTFTLFLPLYVILFLMTTKKEKCIDKSLHQIKALSSYKNHFSSELWNLSVNMSFFSLLLTAHKVIFITGTITTDLTTVTLVALKTLVHLES